MFGCFCTGTFVQSVSVCSPRAVIAGRVWGQDSVITQRPREHLVHSCYRDHAQPPRFWGSCLLQFATFLRGWMYLQVCVSARVSFPVCEACAAFTQNLAARHLFEGLRKLFCSFASTLTTWSYPKILFHFSNSPLSSLFSLLDHCCSLSLSLSVHLQTVPSYNTITGTYADALTFIFLHQQKKKSCFFSPISSYMEAISPLPCWLLRTGLFFLFLPVLIRMSAGSVTCNLSTKPQQFHRDGKYSHNDIILDWDKVSRHDRKLEFSSPVRIPLFFSSRHSVSKRNALHHEQKFVFPFSPQLDNSHIWKASTVFSWEFVRSLTHVIFEHCKYSLFFSSRPNQTHRGCNTQHHVRVSLGTHRRDRCLFYVPARQSDIPDHAQLHPLGFFFSSTHIFLQLLASAVAKAI